MGYCSRSEAVELVRARRVTVNGRQIRDPETPVRLEHDHVAVDDTPVSATSKIYLLMNKPRGPVTTASDEQGRTTVYDLLREYFGSDGLQSSQSLRALDSSFTNWVSPVGRLDKASEGLLLFTNDSRWAAAVTDPAFHVEKRYHVQVDCVVDERLLARIGRGVRIAGEHLRIKTACILRTGSKNSWLEITLDEGKNRHIRRLLDALGVSVLRIVRVSIGPLQLGDLKKGMVRPLTDEEKDAIDRSLDAGSNQAKRFD